jgi:hypothetical protein
MPTSSTKAASYLSPSVRQLVVVRARREGSGVVQHKLQQARAGPFCNAVTPSSQGTPANNQVRGHVGTPHATPIHSIQAVNHLNPPGAAPAGHEGKAAGQQRT